MTTQSSGGLKGPIIRLEEATPEDFLQFLSAPKVEPFMRALSERPQAPPSTVLNWTRSLLGLVHRTQPPMRHREACEGILRWLHGMREAARKNAQGDLLDAISDAADEVSKYGINANTYDQRISAVVPLQTFGNKQLLSSLEIDRLAYQSRLVARRFDVVAQTVVYSADQYEAGTVASFAAVDGEKETAIKKRSLRPLQATCAAVWVGPRLANGSTGKNRLSSCHVAVGWHRSAVTVHRLEVAARGGATPFELVPVPISMLPAEARGGRAMEWAPRSPNSDLIVAGREQAVGSNAANGDSQGPNLWRLATLDPHGQWTRLEVSETLRTSDPMPMECAHSLLWVPASKGTQAGSLFAGLRGVRRTPRFLIFARDASGIWSHPKQDDLIELTPPFSTGDINPNDRVRALASGTDPVGALAKGADNTLLVGCYDGQVWSIEQLGRGSKVCIARLPAPVTALTASGSRIFVGTGSGGISAWEKDNDRWISIWATEEFGRHKGDGIKSLAVIDEGKAVLATVEDGECVLFVNTPPDSGGRLPGDRLDRISLQQTMFAAPLVANTCFDPSWKGDFGLQCSLMVGGETGSLRCFSLHYPRYGPTEPRLQLRERWEAVTRAWAPADAIQLAEAISIAAPYSEQLCIWTPPNVRRAARTGTSAGSVPPPGRRQSKPPMPDEPTFPTFLNPVMLVLNKIPTTPGEWAVCKESDLRLYKDEILRSLRAVVKLRRRFRLFRVLVQQILALTNAGIVATFADSKKAQVAAVKQIFSFYRDLVDGMLHCAGDLAGGSSQRQLNEQLSVLRALDDPEVVHKLTVAVRPVEQKALVEELARSTLREQVAGEAREILSVRTDAIRRMFAQGESLIILETMHAVNLTMMKALVDHPGSAVDIEATRLPTHVEAYLDLVTDYACRAMDDGRSFGFASRLEAARAFALSLAMYPHLAIKVAFQLSEAGLYPSLTDSVIEQIRALAKLGCWGETAWERVLGWFQYGLLRPCKEEPTESGLVAKDDVAAVHALLKAMDDLTSELQGDATAVCSAANTFRERLDGLAAKKGSTVRHSAEFWSSGATEKLTRAIPKPYTTPRGELDVAVIHLSFALTEWAETMTDLLGKAVAKHELFEPNAGFYKQRLERLADAARTFPAGAAVQAAIVRGDLEHDVNEELDNDAFRLHSIARAANPFASARDESLPDNRESYQLGAKRFEYDQRASARGAEAVAETIRTIYATMGWKEKETKADDRDDRTVAVYYEFADKKAWETPDPAIAKVCVSKAQAAAIGVLLNQLHRNHQLHGGPGKPCVTLKPVADATMSVLLSFPLPVTQDPKSCPTRARLKQLLSELGRFPVVRDESRGRSSNGLGIHLGAASVARAGFKLAVETTGESLDLPGTQLAFSISNLRGQSLSESPNSMLVRSTIEPSISETDTRNVVVVDDRSDFPLHVWTHLGGRLRVGGANSLAPRIRNKLEQAQGPPCFSSHDGKLRVWWVRADERAAQSVTQLLERLKKNEKERTVLLLDQRVSRGNASYDATAFEAKFRKNHPKIALRLISSYSSGGAVLPKSIPTLDTLRGELWGSAGGPWPQMSRPRDKADHRLEAVDLVKPATSESEVHLLVSGAGFEMADEVGGFGMPATCRVIDSLCRDANRLGIFPAFRDRAADHHFRRPAAVRCAANLPCVEIDYFATAGDVSLEATNFDEWWNQVLLAARTRPAKGEPLGDDFASRAGPETEIRLRDLFRHALLESDWSHLEQCIYASVLPFDGWISTNYTQFADRAIALTASLQGPDIYRWQIAASGSEAMRLACRFMHPSKEHDPDSRILFKIHGDISRVDTMTLAGLDKEAESPFYVRLAALHQLYLAARDYVADRLRRNPGAKLVVHVVGHGLQDSMLNRTLTDILMGAQRAGHDIEWRRVDWSDDASQQRLDDALKRGLRRDQVDWLGKLEGGKLERATKFERRKYCTTAARYLASWGRELSAAAPASVPDQLTQYITLDPADIERRD